MKILSNEQYLKRSNKSRRRKVKEKDNNSFVNRLVNVLIVIVAALIIISMTLILTNDDLKNNIKKPDEQSAAVITEGNEQANNNSINDEKEEEDEDEDANEQQDSENEEQQPNENEGNVGQEEGENDGNDGETSSLEEDMQFITTVSTEDPNVEVAFIDSRWTPYPTGQTGTHINAFDINHIDYQEKLKLLYRDTGFTEDTSILWSIRNASGDAVAVISAKNKTNIFRLTMKWIDGQGWQTILVEQLYSLDGAY